MVEANKIVFKVEEGMNPKEILCTTYQMRDFYSQMRDGFFSNLDVMNYIQHYKICKLLKKNYRVLDMCCGRSLMLPLIYYHAKNIESYTGIDIWESNIRNGYGKKKQYPFKVDFKIGNVAEMDKQFQKEYFDFIIYTSSIEHMQKSAGEKSLFNAFDILKPGGKMFLSCPNTIGKIDPYDTQYAAHLYEWDLDELGHAIKNAGFKIINKWGLVSKKRMANEWAETQNNETKIIYNTLNQYLPNEFFLAIIPVLFPEIATEVALYCEKPGTQGELYATKKND